jgi:hypothetical protein
MKAALVIGVGREEAGVTGPELGSALFFANYVAEPRFSKRLTADPALEWVVPTRHADELRTFLAGIGRSRPPARVWLMTGDHPSF